MAVYLYSRTAQKWPARKPGFRCYVLSEVCTKMPIGVGCTYERRSFFLPKVDVPPAARPRATSPDYSLNFRQMDSRKPGELAEEKGRVSNSPCLFSLPPTIQPLVISQFGSCAGLLARVMMELVS
jgi:hypothetical protein